METTLRTRKEETACECRPLSFDNLIKGIYDKEGRTQEELQLA